MSNCYINLCGGIGNQLFQVAAGYAYSKRTNKNFYIDSSRWSAGQGRHGYDYKNSIFQNFEYSSPITRDVIGYQEPQFNYTEIPDKYGSVALNGYFQSLKYFEEYQYEFKNMLTLPKVELPLIDGLNVAFHIRRGDYLNYRDIHYVCDTTYFNRCFKYFEGFQINVFTDSPDYVKEEFKHHSFNLIEGYSELEDLSLISFHDNVVCSNSTFSWWGSFLGGKKDKIIVPKKWFNDGRKCDDIYRKDMIRI